MEKEQLIELADVMHRVAKGLEPASSLREQQEMLVVFGGEQDEDVSWLEVNQVFELLHQVMVGRCHEQVLLHAVADVAGWIQRKEERERLKVEEMPDLQQSLFQVLLELEGFFEEERKKQRRELIGRIVTAKIAPGSEIDVEWVVACAADIADMIEEKL